MDYLAHFTPLKAHLYFNQPVNQDGPHLGVEAGLLGHVVTEDKFFLQTVTQKRDEIKTER